MIKKIISFLIFFFFLTVLVEANQIGFEFKKGLLPNTYYLIINNADDKRTIEFNGYKNNLFEETNYYVNTKNDTIYYIDSKVFGAKGKYWINFNSQGKIPFKIKKDIMQNAKQIIFKGIIYIPKENGGFVEYADQKELTIIYNVANDNTSFEIK